MLKSAFNNNYPLAQLSLAVFISFVSLLVFSILSIPLAWAVFGSPAIHFSSLNNLSDPGTVAILRYYQVVQSVGLFVVPPFILSYIFSGSPFRYLSVDRAPSRYMLGMVVVIMISIIPFINLLAWLNSLIRLPHFMSGVEQYLMKTEEAARMQTDAFLKGNTLHTLWINLLVVAVLPAIGEELMFRGLLQSILVRLTKSRHWGIIIAAFVFSAVHMQFYGFFPRWLLGILFGYLLLWSGSLWLPVCAHFVNNAAAVIVYFLASTGTISEKSIEFGSSADKLPLTISLTILAIVGVWFIWFYSVKSVKKKKSF